MVVLNWSRQLIRYLAVWAVIGACLAGLAVMSVGMAQEDTSSASTPVAAAVDPTVTRLERERLIEEIEQLRKENDRDLGSWVWRNVTGTAIAATIVAAYSIYRWRTDRTDELARRTEARFQETALALGGQGDDLRVAAAVALRTFLAPGLERFHIQVFDLIVGHLRLQDVPDRQSGERMDIPAKSPLATALLQVFLEAYPLARRLIGKPNGSTSRTHSLDASGLRLVRANLRKADLFDAFLLNAKLYRCDLQGARLSSAVLHEADLYASNLDEADLRNMVADWGRLDECSLYRADLSNVSMKRGTLMGANLQEVKAGAADLEEAVLEGAILDNSNFARANLDRTYMLNARLARTNLAGASLRHAEVSNAKMMQVVMKHANLQGAIFNRANMRDADLTGANLDDADFGEAVLDRADLTGANITDAMSLRQTSLLGVKGLTDEQLAVCEKMGAIVNSSTRTGLEDLLELDETDDQLE